MKDWGEIIARCLSAGLALSQASAIRAQATGSAPLRSIDSATSFVENRGQWDSQARFRAQSGGLTLWLTSNGAVFDFQKVVSNSSLRGQNPRSMAQPNTTVLGHVVRMSFVGGIASTVVGNVVLPGKENYFVGSDQSKWAKGARRFAESIAYNIYPGVSARYYFEKGIPRYDLSVQPGADPNQIRMKFSGADGLGITPEGNLSIRTSIGPFEERGLSVYQDTGADKVSIPAKMEVDGDTVKFNVGSYDRSKTLVIDPLIFSTLLGGTSADSAVAVQFEQGTQLFQIASVTVVGNTSSVGFPTTNGAYQRTNFSKSAFVTKLAPDGRSLIWSSFIGVGFAYSGALTTKGEVVVAGFTSAVDFPVTSLAFQKTLSGGEDGFVSKLSEDGSTLEYSTYLGGGGNDQVRAVTVDQGHIIVGGVTASSDFPTTEGTLKGPAAGAEAGFAAQFNLDGSHLNFSTLLDGSQDSLVQGVAADADGNIYVSGFTNSSDFPTTLGAVQVQLRGALNAFVAKFSLTSGILFFSTLLGGSVEDTASSVAVDSEGVVITGSATSTDFPVTAGSFQHTFGGTQDQIHGDGFVSKISLDGKTLIWSTFVGGSAGDSFVSVALDAAHNVVVAGSSISRDYPVTKGAYETTFPINSNLSMTVVTKLNSNGTGLLWSTYMDGDTPNAMALSPFFSDVAVVGSTFTSGFPTTHGAFQSAAAGDSDAFVTELSSDGGVGVSGLSVSPNLVVGGSFSTGTVNLSSTAGPGGASVALTSSSPTVAAPSASLTIPSGRSTGQFPIRTFGVDSTQLVTINASIGGFVPTVTTLTVVPASILNVVPQPGTVVGGNPTHFVVSLNGKAGPSGVQINLTTGTPGVANLPASGTIPAGSSSASFPVTTNGVDAPTKVKLTARIGSGLGFGGFLTVSPASLLKLSLVPADIVGGNGTKLVVFLNGKAGPSGVAVSMASSNTTVATIPSTGTVASGASAGVFSVLTNGVASTTSVTLSAHMSSGSTFTAPLEVEPASVQKLSLTNPSIVGGNLDHIEVFLNGKAGPFGTEVDLSSSNVSVATIQATGTVPAGANSATFLVKTSGVDASSTVTLGARIGSGSPVTATLTVNRATLISLTMLPAAVTGGQTGGAVVRLNGQAGPSGVVVSLFFNSPIITVPATVTVLPGDTAAAFHITTKKVTVSAQVVIKAIMGNVTVSATLTINP